MRLVTESNDTLAAIASEDPDVQNATRLLPGALTETRDALAAAKEFGDELGPTFSSLRPFARNLPQPQLLDHRARQHRHAGHPRSDPPVRALGA